METYGPQSNDTFLVQSPGTYDTGGGSGASDWFQQNGVAIMGIGTNLINGFLSFGANIAAINNQQPLPYGNNQNTGNQNQNQNTGNGSGNNQQQPNYLIWVVVVVVIILILLSALIIFKSSSKTAK